MGVRYARGLGLASLMLAGVILDGSLGLVLAQAPPAAAVARPVAVPSGPLAGALNRLAAQTGLQIVFDAPLAESVTSPGVTGTFAPAEALARVLAGTGFTYRGTGANAVTLERLPPRAQDGGAVTLGTIDVRASAAAQSALESPPGYVATQTRAGTKTDTPILEVPQAISVITREQMDVRNVQRDREALQYSPGIYTEPYGIETRYDSFMLRGFDASRGQYRDGLKLSSGLWTSLRTESYGLERIDVMRGPSSVLYGQNNPGGVINKTTKQPPFEPLREVELEAGNLDRRQAAFDLGGPLDESGRSAYRLTGLFRDSGTQYEFSQGRSVPDDRAYVAPAFTWKPNDDTTLTLLTDYLYTLTDNPFTYSYPGPRPTHVLTGEPGFNKYEYGQLTTGYRLEHRLSDVWNLRQIARYGYMDIEYRLVNGTALQADGRTLTRGSTLTKEQMAGFAIDNQAEARFATGPLTHTLLAGIDYQVSDYESRTRSGTAPSLDVSNPVYGALVAAPTNVTANTTQDFDQLGLYAQDQIKFGGGFIATLGLRHDRAVAETENRRTGLTAIQDDHAYTYRAGLGYVFGNGIAPYASYSESFLPTSGTDFSGNPFQPTTGQQYEIGIKYQPSGFNSFIALAAFDLTQQNVTTPDPARPGTTFRVQTGEIRSRGIELEGVASLAEGLNLVASYTYQDLEVTQSNTPGERGRRPILIPEHMASLWANYTVQGGGLEGLGLGAGVRHVGSTFFNVTNTLQNPSTTLVDASVHYDLGQLDPKFGGALLGLNVQNLFDKDYATCWNATTCTWGLSRSVIGSVKYRW